MRNQKGITLIALIITIIVMLILVGVSVTVALNGGLFRTAQDAAENTNAERDKEYNLSSGRIKVGNTWYDSIENYVNETPSANQGDTEVEVNTRTGPLGAAVDTSDYGKKVVGYTSKGEGLEDIVWRLFYKDANNVYLISSKETTSGDGTIVKEYPLSGVKLNTTEITSKYSNGADVSIQGQDLMPLANALFTDTNTNANIIGTAYLCDIEAWDQYTDAEGKAAWAMGGPTMELFKESFNAISENDFTVSVGSVGYNETNLSIGANAEVANGIYRLNNSNSQTDMWWFASPAFNQYTTGHMCGADDGDGDASKLNGSELYANNGFFARPVVCIPVANFNFTLQ